MSKTISWLRALLALLIGKRMVCNYCGAEWRERGRPRTRCPACGFEQGEMGP
jgi:rubrerythrin